MVVPVKTKVVGVAEAVKTIAVPDSCVTVQNGVVPKPPSAKVMVAVVAATAGIVLPLVLVEFAEIVPELVVGATPPDITFPLPST